MNCNEKDWENIIILLMMAKFNQLQTTEMLCFFVPESLYTPMIVTLIDDTHLCDPQSVVKKNTVTHTMMCLENLDSVTNHLFGMSMIIFFTMSFYCFDVVSVFCEFFSRQSNISKCFIISQLFQRFVTERVDRVANYEL